ncbi:type 1 glutamine amidotransferase domain-containing protein [Nostocales cyanobacterium LEGE 11386]|nr:type 1 glutamine amidotransferase domain-containing protein [Nostocales cyanobacterium LEGE 11386]
MSAKVLIVLTSHDKLGSTDQTTGFYLPEVSHPVAVFNQAGFTVDYVSPKGGKAPMIGVDLKDPLNQAFLDNLQNVAQIENTLRPDQINPAQFNAILYAGGHGTMWDFPNNAEIANIAAAIYEQGGVVGAVCHGPAGLVNLKLLDGKYLVTGKKIACFTNEEEAAVGLSEVVPFLLASALIGRGALHTKAENFQKHVVVSDHLVTGQNPASATGVAEQMVKLLTQVSLTPVGV